MAVVITAASKATARPRGLAGRGVGDGIVRIGSVPRTRFYRVVGVEPTSGDGDMLARIADVAVVREGSEPVEVG
jgi:hypothetical protein